MTDATTSPIIDGWVKVMIIILIIAAIIEVSVLILAYVKADKVECNFIFCKFSTTKGASIITQDCFTNGIRTNCSTMKEIQEAWWNNEE